MVEFSSGSSKNRLCLLCSGNELVCATYNKLKAQFEINHNIQLLKIESYTFPNQESFDQRFEEQKIEITCSSQEKM